MRTYKLNMEIPLFSVIKDMPNDVYHAHDSISKSGLDLILRSPAHYKFREYMEPSRAMEIGTAIHTALLEPDRFAKEYVLLKDVKDRRTSEYKQAVSVHGSERVLVAGEADNVAGMQAAVFAHPVASSWLALPGHAELSMFAKDPETGVVVRIRPDYLTEYGSIVDIKKTQDARQDAFSKSISTYRYHVQAAFYMDVYQWVTGERAESFRFIAIEEKMPHACMVYKLDDLSIAEGRRLYRQALNTYADCLASGEWKSYDCDSEEIISLPDWEIRRIENELEVNLGE